ncbi:polysaccharide deacetylase family protein [Luteipulveratus halotolerans]|uniref:polysaccharide deacetylase family protein n=1 Tax=Luteipulveratus halotolerans TaxID=1631356 RepID=UPI0009E26DC0|nr:polysaccharide deacetylase family protein [Luteipulveratus halotolerans]
MSHASITAAVCAAATAVVVAGGATVVPARASGTPATTSAAPAATAAFTDIYFTFDDGPHPTWTPRVLAVLRKYNARATFFMVGQNVVRYPYLLSSVRAYGHHTSNHTWSHPNLTQLSTASVTWQLNKTDAAMGSTRRKCVRPPYGATNDRIRSIISARGQRQVLWNIDTRDWSRPGTTTIYNRIVYNARPGRIVLMHDGGGDRSQTVAALDRALANLRSRGYTFRYIPYC